MTARVPPAWLDEAVHPTHVSIVPTSPEPLP